jgi:hypothetical protein
MSKKRKPRPYTPLSVARVAIYCHHSGHDKCLIVAEVLLALGYDDLACRASSYITVTDLITPAFKVITQAAENFFIAREAIVGLLEWGTGEGLLVLTQKVESLPIIYGIPTLPALIKKVSNFLSVLTQPIKDIIAVSELLDYAERYKDWVEAVNDLENVAKTKAELDCICKAYHNISDYDFEALIKHRNWV